MMLEEIPNFPPMFMDRHMAWHMGVPPGGRTITQGQPGSGAEFLDFHHQYVADVKAWYATQPGADPSKMVAWSQFPADLAAAHAPELANYEAYASNATNFTTEDALGIYVEAEHNSVHGYIASFYGEPEFAQLDSCKYFMFYQWHGMVDAWRGNWLVHHKSAVKDLVDLTGHKHVVDKVSVVDKVRIAEVIPKHLVDVVVKQVEVPKGPKELVEVPGVGSVGGDPVEQLSQRLSQLETVVHRQSFIQPQERPAVG